MPALTPALRCAPLRSLALLLLLLLPACLPQPRPPLLTPWVYTDLRAVDARAAPDPGQDLVAVYTRSLGEELQFRLDLLDVHLNPSADLYLALDTQDGGSNSTPPGFQTQIEWDTLLILPASGQIRAVSPEGVPLPNLAVRVERDPVADTITVSLNRPALPGSPLGFRFQVLLTPPGVPTLSDGTGPLASAGSPPPRVPVLLAFWNALPAYTPAQALRRWDGAHTGPFGGRHGLHNLLRAARNRGLPLALLDLKTPTSLSALDAAGGLNLVRAMAGDGLLILPDSAPVFPPYDPVRLPAAAWEGAVAASRQAAQDFGLPASPFLYLPPVLDPAPGGISPLYRFVITLQDPPPQANSGAAALLRRGEQVVLPVSPDALIASQVGLDAEEPPPLALRRALAGAAQLAGTGGSSTILVLGGDLPQSTWGDPRFSRLTLDWLATHPWVQVLGPQDLLAARPEGKYRPPERIAGEASHPPAHEVFSALAEELGRAPAGPLTQAAWQAYLALLAPLSPAPAELMDLRAHYAGQVSALLAAARWAAAPEAQAGCNQDLDRDGQRECLLASETVFALFEMDTGALSFLFARSPGGGVHQLVGLSSQFITGMGDSTTWDFSAGLAADPLVYPGAFADRHGPYQISITGEGLQFTDPDTGYAKIYRLLPAGLQARFHLPAPSVLQIPLALDPWERFTPGWKARYTGQLAEGAWHWGLAGGPRLQVSSNGRLSAHSFTDSSSLMGAVEDPNFDYPPGHFLPFPLSLVEIQGESDIVVEISLEE